MGDGGMGRRRFGGVYGFVGFRVQLEREEGVRKSTIVRMDDNALYVETCSHLSKNSQPS